MALKPPHAIAELLLVVDRHRGRRQQQRTTMTLVVAAVLDAAFAQSWQANGNASFASTPGRLPAVVTPSNSSAGGSLFWTAPVDVANAFTWNAMVQIDQVAGNSQDPYPALALVLSRDAAGSASLVSPAAGAPGFVAPCVAVLIRPSGMSSTQLALEFKYTA